MGIRLLENTLVPNDILGNILSIPFSVQFNGVLWFVYMLIGLYTLASVISPWLNKTSRKELEFYLIIWAVTLFFPLIRNLVTVNESTTGIFYYIGGYVGYFLLGYYLHRYTSRIPLAVCCFLIILPLSIGAIYKLQGIQVEFYDMFGYLSILTVCAAVGWFALFKKVTSFQNFTVPNCIVLIGNCCFGIYLSHIFVMRTILWRWGILQELGGGIQILLTSALTFAGSLLITWLLSLLPIGAYLVGFRNITK